MADDVETGTQPKRLKLDPDDNENGNCVGSVAESSPTAVETGGMDRNNASVEEIIKQDHLPIHQARLNDKRLIDKDNNKQREEEDMQSDGSGSSGLSGLNGDESRKADKINERSFSDDNQDDADNQNDDNKNAQSGQSDDSDGNWSDLSGEESWRAKPAGGESLAWVYKSMSEGVNPRSILKQILPDEAKLPRHLDDFTLWKIIVNLVSEPPPRKKLENFNTLDDVLHLLKTCQKIVVLTGAGVSVSCGIPDFRSKNGVYARLAVDYPDLPDPQAMFDIHYFRHEQRPFFKFAKEIFPGQFEPSKCHKFIQLIEQHGKLLRNYTQNIDTLEQVAGIQNVIQCHGSFATATCMVCKYKCPSDDIKQDIVNQVIPMCPKCERDVPLSVMKPDIVFFGESLPEEFHDQMAEDKDECDLLIVIGSSLKVRPVALIPNSIPANVPQILINKEHLRNLNFDVELLGDCDTIVGELCRRLGDKWSVIANPEPLVQVEKDELPTPPLSPTQERYLVEVKGGDSEANAKNVGDDNKNVGSSEPGSSKLDDSEIMAKETVDSGAGNPKVESDLVNDKVDKDDGSAMSEKTVDGKTTDNAGEIKTICSENRDAITVPDTSAIIPDHSSTKSDENRSQNNPGEKPTTEKVKMCTSNHDNVLGKKSEIPESFSQDGDANHAINSDTTTAAQEKNNGTSSLSGAGADSACEDTIEEPRPGTSSDCAENEEKPLAMGGLRQVYKQNLALSLEPNQFCFLPPHQYLFPHAEFYVRIAVGDDLTDRFCADLDRTRTTDSSGQDDSSDDFMELSSCTDEEEEDMSLEKEGDAADHDNDKSSGGVGEKDKDNAAEKNNTMVTASGEATANNDCNDNLAGTDTKVKAVAASDGISAGPSGKTVTGIDTKAAVSDGKSTAGLGEKTGENIQDTKTQADSDVVDSVKDNTGINKVGVAVAECDDK